MRISFSVWTLSVESDVSIQNSLLQECVWTSGVEFDVLNAKLVSCVDKDKWLISSYSRGICKLTVITSKFGLNDSTWKADIELNSLELMFFTNDVQGPLCYSHASRWEIVVIWLASIAITSIRWIHFFVSGLNFSNNPINDEFLSKIVESSNRNNAKWNCARNHYLLR